MADVHQAAGKAHRVTTQRALWDEPAAKAARLRRVSERLHCLADLARDRRAREHLRYRAVEVWKQADALVPEECVR